jgi:pyruvate dehydrogenase E2 component (dihydrolipoamide acetyltransferase)
MAEIVMPRLSDSMEEGTILQWLKKVGDQVAIGEELVEIETDKANMAYESDLEGTLSEIVVGEGETVPIGAVIARVGDGDGDAAQDKAAQPAGPVAAGDAPPPPVAEASSGAPRPAGPVAAGNPPPPPVAKASSGEVPPTAPPAGEAAPSGDGHRPKASPIARRLAKEKGLDLTQLHGSGPGGRIVKADVEKAESGAGIADAGARPGPYVSPPGRAGAEQMPVGGPETAKGETAYEDLSKLQATIARRMSESKATAPHFYLEAEVDMSQAVEARARLKALAAEGEAVPSFNDMVVKACAIALREFPRANGAYRDGRFELYSRVNVGVAVAARDALVVPTIFDADRKGLSQIAAEARALAARVRDGTVTPPELSGGTFSVSNLGMFGIDSFSAVINPPQAGILAVGSIRERPVVRDGALVAAHTMWATLACDHRILYGADGAEFLARVRALLEEPLSLAL